MTVTRAQRRANRPFFAWMGEIYMEFLSPKDLDELKKMFDEGFTAPQVIQALKKPIPKKGELDGNND